MHCSIAETPQTAHELNFVASVVLLSHPPSSLILNTFYKHWSFYEYSLHCICPYPDIKTASTIPTFIVHCKLDYCISLYYNLPNCQLKRLCHIQNALANAVVKFPKFSHASAVLWSLHWLRINERIEYKFCLPQHILITPCLCHTSTVTWHICCYIYLCHFLVSLKAWKLPFL